MIYFFKCPETGKEIMIIKGASHIFWAVQGVQFDCERTINCFLDFNQVATRSMTETALNQARPYRNKLLYAKDMQEIILRACGGENTSGDSQIFLCDNCGTASRYRTQLSMGCRQCETLVQPYGYLVTHDPSFIHRFAYVFQDNNLHRMTSAEFLHLSKRLLQSIADA